MHLTELPKSGNAMILLSKVFLSYIYKKSLRILCKMGKTYFFLFYF